MRALRALICSLLVDSAIVGIAEDGDAFSNVTSYSTWTTTYTTQIRASTTATLLTTAGTTALMQRERTGPYLLFDVRFIYFYEPGGQNVVGFRIQGWVENLMTTIVEGGTIRTL